MKQGWEIKKLGDVCDTGAGGTPLKAHKDYYEGGTIPWLMSGEVSQGEVFEAKNFITEKGLKNSSAKLFPIDTVLVAMYGATAGQVGILKFEACTNQAVCGILPNHKTIPEYLFYCFLSKKEELVAQAVGGAQPNISQIKIRNTAIPLPPLPEQQRIVAILDEAFAAIAKAKANAEQNLKNAKELFESYLQSVFENKGEGWEEKALEDLVDEKCTLSYGIVQPGDEYSDGLPVVRPTDLTRRFISINGLKRIDPKLAEGYKRTTLRGNELLLCVRGSTGIISIAMKELKGANVTRGIVPIHFDSEIVNQEFGYYLLISNYIQRQIKAKTYGAALMQINIGDLRKILMPYPPFKAQQTIVQKLDALSAETKRLEAIYQQKIKDLEELKKSVLQKAFNGELNTKAVAV